LYFALSQVFFATNSAPYCTAYRNWLSELWQWSVGIPATVHPFKNYTPEKCALHQAGPVWFLPSVPETNQTVIHICTIPAGKAVAFDIESGECDRGLPDVRTDNDMITCATTGNFPAYVALRVSIDGTPVQNINQYRVQSDIFNLTIPQDNIFDAKPGAYRAVTSGYLIILEPLAAGNHVINYADQVTNPTQTQYNHQKSVIYKLLVMPSSTK
jgi:hypothetical protein